MNCINNIGICMLILQAVRKLHFQIIIWEKIHKEYDEIGDYALQSGEVMVRCKIDSKHFAICVLDEHHMPCLCDGEVKKNKNVIFKIMVE